ncbi:MAG: ATP-binding cassette domain-containing protein [Phycisphaerae bacterium]
MNRRLTIKDLSIRYGSVHADGSHQPLAVDHLSLDIRDGETVALVGESGSGKSTVAFSIMGLLDWSGPYQATGTIQLRVGNNWLDMLNASEPDRAGIRGRHVAMIFQNPATALNPVMTVGRQIAEVFELHENLSRRASREAAIEVMERVGLREPASCARMYPHQLSGGMQQRVVIAMAIACRPKLLVADEPTTALDVTLQAQILECLLQIQSDMKMAMLLVSHDLGVVAKCANEVHVLRSGCVVEAGPVDRVLIKPQHPYTQNLLACMP